MKFPRARVVAAPLAFLSCATALQSHPGHDGHELTWDFSHLAAFPVATLLCAATLTTAAFAGWWVARRLATAQSQSLRRSQPSRGK